MPPAQPNPLFFLVPILIILPVLYFRLRRSMKPQQLKPNQLWVRPALYLVVVGLVMSQPVPGSPPLTPNDLIWLAVAALAGAAAGWQMGRLVAIEPHPENGTLLATGGQAAAIVIVVLVVLRLGLRAGLTMEAPSWHINPSLILDASMVFAASLFAVRGLEMFLRARTLLAKAPL